MFFKGSVKNNLIQDIISVSVLKPSMETLRYSREFNNIRDGFYRVDNYINIFNIYDGIEYSVRTKYLRRVYMTESYK